MQYTVGELRDKLLKALDNDNNVVDMPTVLEVLSSLEKSHITRECLEETRVGKYVNEMRKKTSNKDLAKRAKNLVKKWQQLFVPQPTPSNPPAFNGSKPVKSVLPPSVKQCYTPTSPALSSSSDSPALQKIGHVTANRMSPANTLSKSSSVAAFKPISPALPTHLRSNSSACLGRQSPFETPRSQNGHFDRSDTQVDQVSLNSSLKRKQTGDNDAVPEKKRLLDGDISSASLSTKHSNTVANGRVSSYNSKPSLTSHSLELSQHQSGGTTPNATTVKRKRGRPPLARTPSVSSLHSDVTNKSTPSRVASTAPVKTPRVKTTAELLKEMANEGSLNISGSAAVRKIALNQIDKEHDEDISIVPDGAKPRRRKKERTLDVPPQIHEKPLKETKDEMVHKFLATSVSTPLTPDIDLSSDPVRRTTESPKNGFDHTSFKGSLNGAFHKDTSQSSLDLHVKGNNHNGNELDHRRIAPVRIKLSSMCANGEQSETLPNSQTPIIPDDPWSLLQEIDTESIDWHSLDYEPPSSIEVTPTVIERLHSEQWPGVNGQRDTWNDWRNWTETYSAASYNGDFLHVLPYVLVEENEDRDDDDELRDFLWLSKVPDTSKESIKACGVSSSDSDVT